MSVILGPRNTGSHGMKQCVYGCCGYVTNPSNKRNIRKTIRSAEKREFARDLKRGEF